MVQGWDFGSAGTWIGPLLLLAAAAGVIVGFLARRLVRIRQGEFEAELICREVRDECFAKSELAREDCEERCKGMGHPRETPRPPPSAPPDLAP